MSNILKTLVSAVIVALIAGCALFSSERPKYIPEAVQALRENKEDELKKIVSKQGPNIIASNGESILMLAIAGGHTEIADYLIDAGANLNLQDRKGNTALIYAAGRDNKNVVEKLLKKGADPNLENNHGKSPLMEAARMGEIDIVKLLLENGSDIEESNKHKKTPLMFAVFSNKNTVEIMELLIKNGAGLDDQDDKGLSAVMWAARLKKPDAVKLLGEKGANLELEDKNSMTVMHWAAISNDLKSAKYLVEKRVPYDNTKSLMMKAAQKTKFERGIHSIRTIFLQRKFTPLMVAAEHGSYETAKFFLDEGADPNTKNDYEQTALHMAKDKEMTTLLKKYGAEK